VAILFPIARRTPGDKLVAKGAIWAAPAEGLE
jgi:hypothetical protein